MVHIHSGILLSHKQGQNNAIGSKWMEPETLILSEVREIPYDITYIWNLIQGTNEPIYRKETNSWTWRTDLWLPRGWRRKWEGLGVWGH